MSDKGIIYNLQQENARLKQDNELLLSILAQMKVTLNRLISRYVKGSHPGQV